MKVLLIRPPTTHFPGTTPPVCGLPLGLLYIAGVLDKNGYDVQIYDAIIDTDKIHWLPQHGASEFQMGSPLDEIHEKIKSVKPDIVGITNQFSSQIPNAIKVAEIVKKVYPKAITVIGGPHATVMPTTFFTETKGVDIVIVGEGEYSFYELVDSISKGKGYKTVDGIVFKGEKGQIVHSNRRETIYDLDNLPFPAYHLIDTERFFLLNSVAIADREIYRYKGSERAISMITSRGCPFNCTFCSIHLSMGHRFRSHTKEYVVNHIEFVVNNYNVKHIHFEDDNLTFDSKRFEEILDQLIKKGIRVTWDTPNGIRADYIDDNILKKCKKSGCTYLRIGIESGSEFVRNNVIKKRLDINAVIRVAKACQKIGIDLEAFYIIGFPGETLENMKMTIELASRLEKEYGVSPLLHIATPLYGTELYKTCTDKGYIKTNPSFRGFAVATTNTGMIQTNDFTTDNIVQLLSEQKKIHKNIFIVNSIKFMLKNKRFLILLLVKMLNIIFQNQFKPRLMYQEIINAFKYKNCFIRSAGNPIKQVHHTINSL